MEYYFFLIIKVIIGFVVVISYMNFTGKTQLSQMTPVDFIGNFILGGIVGGVIYNDAIPMSQYLSVLLLAICLISFLNWVSKHIWFFRSIAIGEPIPIIKKGKFLMENIKLEKNKVDMINVASQLHSQGVHSFQEVFYAQIEPNGSLSVICEGGKMPSLILMKDGSIRLSELDKIEKDEEWLNNIISRLQLDNKEIFLAEFWGGEVVFILNDGSVKVGS